jgi:hypothetical protein
MNVTWWAVAAVGTMSLSSLCALAQEAKPAGAPAAGLEAKRAGDTFALGSRQVTVREMDVTPVVRNEYSKVFDFDCFANLRCQQLRRQEKLDDVVAKGASEFDKQVLLMDWTYKRFKLFGAPSAKPGNVLEILRAVDEGNSFNCGYYADVLQAALGSEGWVVRAIGLKGAKSDGNGSEHSILEVWSSQYRKWIVLDPTLNIYFEKGGVPLNAYEIRQEWFYNKGKDLVIVIGAERERHTTADLPIVRATHKGFGNLGINGDSLGKFLYIAYQPTTRDGKPDYANMFITKDQLCEGVQYHTRKNPADPAHEPYWPMCQAALALTPSGDSKLDVAADTVTPDFADYRWRVDGGDWRQGPPGQWTLHEGSNSLEVVSVNKFGREGVPSKVVLEAK